MGMDRRRYLFALSGAVMTSAHVKAQSVAEFPNRALRLIVPWPAGGGTDTVCRGLAKELQRILGQPVVVDNRPGATGTLGSEQARRSPADGYTLVFVNTLSHSLQQVTNKALPYDPLRDFAPLGLVSTLPLGLMVHPSVPARDWTEFLAYARTQKDKLNMASPGVGTAAHFFGLLLKQRTGVDLTLVPYKGDSEAVKDFIAGVTQVWLSGVNLALVNEGRMRVLATTGTARWSKLPALPTMVELGMPDFVAVSVSGLAAPVGTPEPVLARLNAALVQALAAPDVVATLDTLGQERGNGSPRDLWRLLEQTTRQFRQIAKSNNLVFD